MNMLKKCIIGVAATSLLAGSIFAQEKTAKPTTASSQEKVARPTSDFFQKAVVYHILLPVFTQEGTLKKAEEFLPHIASLGVDIGYLCPIAEADDDTNLEFWSKRQKASQTGNPKNPYRIKDYFKIDPMHGTDADLKSFVATAHKLGMKVVLDLVYYHCGPTATMITANPDFVNRTPDGKVKLGRWNFPELNFKNPKLREHLFLNMDHFIKNFDVDGYRTDVEASVPADFWAEGYLRIKKLKPDVIMMAESERADAQVDAYDSNYSFAWEHAIIDSFSGTKNAKHLEDVWTRQFKKFVKGARVIRALDNHDIASDAGGRFEKKFTSRGMDAVQVLNFTIDGIPFLYNGNEIADDVPISMFSTNKHGRYFVEWGNALTENGKRRIGLIRNLVKFHHETPAIYSGSTTWVATDKPDSVIAFTRNKDGKGVIVIINITNKEVDVSVPFKGDVKSAPFVYGAQVSKESDSVKVKMSAYGYVVMQY